MSEMKEIHCRYINLGSVISHMQTPEHVVKRLLEDGDKLKESYNKNLAGHLDRQFKYSKETTSWFYNEVLDYWNSYLQIWCEFNAIDNKQIHFYSKTLWVNYMQPLDYNPMHTHDSDLTFVIYLDVPKEIHDEQVNFKGKSAPPGSIDFKYKLDEHHDKHIAWQWGKSSVFMKPKTGDFFIFPAKLHHTVAPFKSDVTRISVSGNLEIVNKADLNLNSY